MAKDLPYLPMYKNVQPLFDKIAAAKAPETFTQSFLSSTLGFASTNDRPLIPLLKTLGFLDSAGKPTTEYGLLKNKSTARAGIAEAIRRAYEPLFAANENAHALTMEELKGLISQVAGTDEGMTGRIAGTFNALVKCADFAVAPKGDKQILKAVEKTEGLTTEADSEGGALRPEFHYNIQVHLPSNASEETYLSIFNALRRVFR
jgi:hypothetical protein